MNKIIKAMLAISFALFVAVAGVGIANAVTASSEPAVPGGPNVVIRGGVMRIGSGTNLYLHQNSAHGAVGITGWRLIDNCDLQIDLDRQPDERIVAAIAEEDETISRLDVDAGISGGNEQANIYLYKNGTKICANNSMFGTNANLWIHLTYIRVPEVVPPL